MDWWWKQWHSNNLGVHVSFTLTQCVSGMLISAALVAHSRLDPSIPLNLDEPIPRDRTLECSGLSTVISSAPHGHWLVLSTTQTLSYIFVSACTQTTNKQIYCIQTCIMLSGKVMYVWCSIIKSWSVVLKGHQKIACTRKKYISKAEETTAEFTSAMHSG